MLNPDVLESIVQRGRAKGVGQPRRCTANNGNGLNLRDRALCEARSGMTTEAMPATAESGDGGGNYFPIPSLCSDKAIAMDTVSSLLSSGAATRTSLRA